MHVILLGLLQWQAHILRTIYSICCVFFFLSLGHHNIAMR